MSEIQEYLNRIICGDALVELKKLPDESIDLTITSPPYNLGNTHHTGNKRHHPYDDEIPETQYQNYQIKVLNGIYRITKNNGSLFYNHKNRIKNGLSIIPYQWLFKTKWLIKQEIVWWNGGELFDKIRFFPQTERIYWLVKKSETKLYNIINILDIWRIMPVGINQLHTRQFPEKLVSNIINCFKEAEIIFDPFCGAGTTCLVAKKLGRNYIGIDLNPDYVKMGEKRILEDCGSLF